MHPLCTDEKHYVTLNQYLREKYQKKVFKVSLNGDFTCPNRDGTIGYGGCIFCSLAGSGDFAGAKSAPLAEQFHLIKNQLLTKWADGYYIAYFQANTNTYAPLDELIAKYSQIITKNGPIDPNIKVLSIATRPDCLSDETIHYLQSLTKWVDVWVELGLQTIHSQTISDIRRGYENACFENMVQKLHQANITTIVHIIDGLPKETKADMLETISYLNKLPIQGIKIHMLHIMKETTLAKLYQDEPFSILSLPEYVDIVTEQLYHLRPDIVVHRITGDAPKDLLIAPVWTLQKFVVMNEIDKKMRHDHLYQGDRYVQNR